MLEARRGGFFSRAYVVEERGRTLATLRYRGWRDLGTLELGERRLEIRQEGFWHPKCSLHDLGHGHGHERLVVAQAAGFFRRGFYLAHGDDEYRLDPSSFFGRAFALSGRRRELGEVRRVSPFSQRVRIDLDADLPLELRLFALYLALLAWRRGARAVAA